MKISGSCACGGVAYEVSDDTGMDIANCHCAQCRRSSGGTYVTWATVRKDRFTWTRGEPAAFPSSGHTTRFFCPRCGTQLALFTVRVPDTIDLTVASFTEPDRYPPSRDIWLKRKLSWVPRAPGLPGEDEENLHPDLT